MPKNFGGHVTLTKPPFLKKYLRDNVWTDLETRVSNVKSVALTVSDEHLTPKNFGVTCP